MSGAEISNAAPKQKIKKCGPFGFSGVTADLPYFAHVLAPALSQLKELPDFSGDTKIAVMSDFSGEHKGPTSTRIRS